MKQIFTLILILLYSGFLYGQAPINGLIAYYPLDGNANDASGSNRNGIIYGATPAADRFNQPNKAYSFNGTSDYIRVANWQILTGNASRTMAIWFKMPMQDQISRTMVAWGSNQVNNQLSWISYYRNQNKNFGFFWWSNDYYLLNNTTYLDDRWHHIVVTYNGNGTMRLWLDGVKVSSANVTGNPSNLNTASSDLFIGNFSGNSPVQNSFFQGQLDDIRIYDRGLSDSEVTAIYQSEVPPPSAEYAKIGVNRFIHTVGVYNTSVGNMAGNAISSGTNNTFNGYQTGRDNSSGSFNTFMGYRAGYQATVGSNNVFLGANANPVGANASSIQNSVALGVNAKVATSDAIVLGDTMNTNLKVGIGTAAPRYSLDVKGSINIGKGNNGVGKLIFASRASIYSDDQQHIVLSGGQPGESGLRLANMTNQSPTSGITSQFLGVDNQGRVGVYSPSLSALQVRLKVSQPSHWADYVFEESYPLMSVSELRSFLRKHRHLPHLPSAKDMVEKGATVEELIKGLVRTQEEQAKYILELQKKNEKLQIMIETLLKK